MNEPAPRPHCANHACDPECVNRKCVAFQRAMYRAEAKVLRRRVEELEGAMRLVGLDYATLCSVARFIRGKMT